MANPFKPGDTVEANEGGIFGLVKETTIGGQGHPCVIMLTGHDAKEAQKVRISGIHLLEKSKYKHFSLCSPDRLCGCPDFKRTRQCQNPKIVGESQENLDEDRCCPFLQCGCYWPTTTLNVAAGENLTGKNKRKYTDDTDDDVVEDDLHAKKKARNDGNESKAKQDKPECKECKRLVNVHAFIEEHGLCIRCAEKQPDLQVGCLQCKAQVLFHKEYAPLMKLCCKCAKAKVDAKVCICIACKQQVHDFDYFDEYDMCYQCVDAKGTEYDKEALDEEEAEKKAEQKAEQNAKEKKSEKKAKNVDKRGKNEQEEKQKVYKPATVSDKLCWIVEPADCLDDGFRDWIFGEGKHPDSIERICTLTEEARDAHIKRINIEFAKGFEKLLRKRRRGLKYTNKITKRNVERFKKGKKVILHTYYLIDGLKFKDDNEWCGGHWKSEAKAKEFIKFLDMIKADKPITDIEWLLKMAMSYCEEEQFAKYEELPIGQ